MTKFILQQYGFNETDTLVQQYGSGLIVQYKITPALLGGLRIRVGNDVFDGSVQGRLDRFADAF